MTIRRPRAHVGERHEDVVSSHDDATGGGRAVRDLPPSSSPLGTRRDDGLERGQSAEYNVPGQQIGHGSRIGSATVAPPPPSASVTDTEIRSFLQRQISAGPLPAADPQTLYFVYTPPGAAVVQGGSR